MKDWFEVVGTSVCKRRYGLRVLAYPTFAMTVT